ncbi:MAG: ThiF family adenylyltransferase [Bacteroidetes bacterium]|nr:ThiF family adenylyltransferase [Bacteroidota bacterium]
MSSFTQEEYNRYNRHIILQEVGEIGQLRLKNAKVLVVGAGGLGCPALLYLASVGVGTIGIIDGDVVDESNLQRQILYTSDDIGKPKASTSANKLHKQNPYVTITQYNTHLTNSNAVDIIPNFDIIIDGTDNFATRYLINDACVLCEKPFIHGSLHKFDGHVAVLNHLVDGESKRSATYRCIFPFAPQSGTVQNCSEIGVLGVMPGIIGTLQATEAIKFILGLGELHTDSLLLVNALTMNFDKIAITRNEKNWGNIPRTLHEFSKMDYQYLCGEISIDSVKEINSVELLSLLAKKEDIQLIDIRTINEVPSLESIFPFYIKRDTIPLNSLVDSIEIFDKATKTILICQSGNRSLKVVRHLQDEHGITNIYSLKGGIIELLNTISNYNE